MTPAARVQAAITVLADWQAGQEGLDRVLAAWGRSNRYAGSKDRRAVADIAYGTVRRWRSARWTAGAGDAGTARDAVRGALQLDGADLGVLFDGSTYGPDTLSLDEMAGPRALDDASRAVRLDYPDWLAPHLETVPDAELAQLRTRAPVHLRVNTLKGDVAAAQRALGEEGVETVPGPLSATALEVRAGATKIAQSRAYRDGLVEIQDAASQAVAEMAAPCAGDRVLDLCAGGGGKTLALGALIGGEGGLAAYDVSPARMADLGPRAVRAGLRVEILTAPPDPSTRQYDVVMVDAPCSGAGAWRRNPDAKWRLSEGRLSDLFRTQGRLLDQAAALTAPAGRLVYATCSVMACENEVQVQAFCQRASGWSVSMQRQFWPSDGGDGFFAAVLTRG